MIGSFAVNFLESIVEYQKEISNLKDSLREVRHERDAYVKQIENMMDNFSKNKGRCDYWLITWYLPVSGTSILMYSNQCTIYCIVELFR